MSSFENSWAAMQHLLSIVAFGFSMDFLTSKLMNFLYPEMQCFQDKLQSFLLYGVSIAAKSIAVTYLPPQGIHMFFLCVTFHDGLMMIICEWIRHLRNAKDQD